MGKIPGDLIPSYPAGEYRQAFPASVRFPGPTVCYRGIEKGSLTGKPVSLCKIDAAYLMATEPNEFRPVNLKKVESDITHIKNYEFTPDEISDTTLKRVRNNT